MDIGDYPFSWPSTGSGIPTSFSRLSAGPAPAASRRFNGRPVRVVDLAKNQTDVRAVPLGFADR
jgi:hypothetical protein